MGLDDDSVSDPGSRTSQGPERDVTMDRLADALTRLADSQHPRPDRVDKDEESRKGVIRINPNVRWPKLADNDTDIDSFMDEFNAVTQLANDGRGMKVADKLLTLGQCLQGSKLLIYQNLVKNARRNMEIQTNPQKVYDEIVRRMEEFRESLLERQRRIQRDYQDIVKGRLSALQFLPIYELAVDELTQVGLGKSDTDLLLAYLDKIGSRARMEILKDQRDRGDGAGIRQVKTWREAHRILVSLEELEDGGRAFHINTFSTAADDGKGKRKKQKGKGKGKERVNMVAATGPGEEPVGVCWQERDRGKCTRPNCHFSHDAKRVAEARAELGREKGGKGKGKDKPRGMIAYATGKQWEDRGRSAARSASSE